MSPLTGPGLVAAALLALAGAQKLVDPDMTVGAMRAMRLPSSRLLVRAGSAAEVVLGVAAIVVGGPVVWFLVSLSYVGFGVFVVTALRRGTMIGSCGCFGREETPPHWTHVVLNAMLAGAGAAAATIDASIVDAIAEEPLEGAILLGLAAVSLYICYAAFAELPRLFAAAAAVRT